MKFVSNLLKQHLQRYPQMQIDDVYKLLHQAATGAAHAAPNSLSSAAHAAPNSLSSAAQAAPSSTLPSVADVLKRLRDEVRSLVPGPTEPLIDPISPDGQLARVHLRAYVAAGHDLAALAHAFVATANDRPPDWNKLERFCGCLGDFADSGEISFKSEDVRVYVARVVADRYPVAHHSELFRNVYRPAYRVVQIDRLTL
jgi:hypothetical protein